MRMWMLNPRCLCRKHLLGEHFEIHKHKHNFVKRHSINGRMFPVVQIEPLSMKVRHDELVNEMIRRKMNHKSEYAMPDVSYLGDILNLKVDINNSLKDLSSRCEDCSKLIGSVYG